LLLRKARPLQEPAVRSSCGHQQQLPRQPDEKGMRADQRSRIARKLRRVVQCLRAPIICRLRIDSDNSVIASGVHSIKPQLADVLPFDRLLREKPWLRPGCTFRLLAGGTRSSNPSSSSGESANHRFRWVFATATSSDRRCGAGGEEMAAASDRWRAANGRP
jgi:hypothetical protein